MTGARPLTLEAHLAASTAAGDTTTYGNLVREPGLRVAEPTARLEQLMGEDARAGKPLRAAVLRQRLSPEKLPAPGFFAKAAGRQVIVTAGEEFRIGQPRRRVLHCDVAPPASL